MKIRGKCWIRFRYCLSQDKGDISISTISRNFNIEVMKPCNRINNYDVRKRGSYVVLLLSHKTFVELLLLTSWFLFLKARLHLLHYVNFVFIVVTLTTKVCLYWLNTYSITKTIIFPDMNTKLKLLHIYTESLYRGN